MFLTHPVCMNSTAILINRKFCSLLKNQAMLLLMLNVNLQRQCQLLGDVQHSKAYGQGMLPHNQYLTGVQTTGWFAHQCAQVAPLPQG